MRAARCCCCCCCLAVFAAAADGSAVFELGADGYPWDEVVPVLPRLGVAEDAEDEGGRGGDPPLGVDGEDGGGGGQERGCVWGCWGHLFFRGTPATVRRRWVFRQQSKERELNL